MEIYTKSVRNRFEDNAFSFSELVSTIFYDSPRISIDLGLALRLALIPALGIASGMSLGIDFWIFLDI